MDIQFIILIVIAIFIGWLLGRLTSKTKKKVIAAEKDCSESYIQGLNYLLANKSDKAIELFVELIKVDKETMETHIALGNLFRSKGEVDKAIKIHQNLIARPNLDQKQRVMALSELAEDYLKAGLLDRAENLFKELVQIDPNNTDALRKLFEIFSIEKSWSEAVEIAVILHRLGDSESVLLLTHSYCEVSEQYISSGNLRDAKKYISHALKTDQNCVRALLLLIDIQLKSGDNSKARNRFDQLLNKSPQYIALYIKPAQIIFNKYGSLSQYQAFLLGQYNETRDISITLELLNNYLSNAQYTDLEKFLKQVLTEAVSRKVYDFTFRYLQSRPASIHQVLPSDPHQLLSADKQIEDNFKCQSCGYTCQTMQWHCPSCNNWSTIKPL